MKSVETALTNAIADATKIPAQGTSSTFIFPVSEFSSILRDFPDQGTVHVEGGEDSPSKVYSPGLSGLRTILEVYRQVTGHEISDQVIDNALRHED